jgi:hypothetical protein
MEISLYVEMPVNVQRQKTPIQDLVILQFYCLYGNGPISLFEITETSENTKI